MGKQITKQTVNKDRHQTHIYVQIEKYATNLMSNVKSK